MRRSSRRPPWWSRLYLAVPRRAIVRFAQFYVRAKAVLGGSKRAQLRRRRLQPYANLMGYPVEQLEATRLIQRTVEQLDELLVYKPAFPLLPPYRIEHQEYLTETLAHGRGAIVGIEHTTHRKLTMGAIRQLGLKARFILPPSRPYNPITGRPPARTLRGKLRQGFLDRVDRSDGMRSTRQVREAFRLLAAGDVVIIATDGRGGELVPVPFLGITMYRPTGPARISYRTGAPIIMAFPRMEAEGDMVLEFFPPIAPRTDLPERDAVLDLMTRIVATVEPLFRAQPWIQGVRFVRQVYQHAQAPGRVGIGLPDHRAVADSDPTAEST